MRIVILILFLAGNITALRAQQANGTYKFSQVGWTITLPDEFIIMDSAASQAKMERGLKAIEDANNITGDISGTIVLISATKNTYNYFNAPSVIVPASTMILINRLFVFPSIEAYSRQPQRKWTLATANSCRLGREVRLYKKSMENGVLRNTYQIAEPVFLRNNTIALLFYKREKPAGYGEFTVLVRKEGKWEQWTKVILLASIK